MPRSNAAPPLSSLRSEQASKSGSNDTPEAVFEDQPFSIAARDLRALPVPPTPGYGAKEAAHCRLELQLPSFPPDAAHLIAVGRRRF